MSWRFLSNILFMMALCLIIIDTAHAQICNKIKYSTHPYYPPFQWYDGEKIIGVSADVMQKVQRDLNFDIEQVLIRSWPRILKSLEKGEIDIVFGAKNAKERAAYAYFSAGPVFDNPLGVFYLKDKNLKGYSVAELIQKEDKALISKGDRFGGDLDKLIDKNRHLVFEAPSQNAAFNMLVKGRGDFFINGLYTGRAGLIRDGLLEQIDYHHIESSNTGLYVLYSKKSKCHETLKDIDGILMRYKEASYFTKLLEQSLEQYVSYLSEE